MNILWKRIDKRWTAFNFTTGEPLITLLCRKDHPYDSLKLALQDYRAGRALRP